MRRSFLLLLILCLVSLPKIQLLHAEEELDEEIKSTIHTDPEFRGKKQKGSTPQTSKPSAPSIHIDDKNKKIVTGKIGFKSNGDTPTPESMGILKQLAAFLAKKPELMIRVEGHSDSVGPDQANLERSQRRADNVKQFLVQQGMAAERLEAVGMGDKYPIASNVTPEGQEKNRRVEFHFVESAGTAAAAPTASPAPAAPSAPTTPPPPPEKLSPPQPAPPPAPVPVHVTPALPAPPPPPAAIPVPETTP